MGSKSNSSADKKLRKLPPYIKTTEDAIFYYYAKLVIAVAAGLKNNYGFIINRFKELKQGKINMSGYDREIREQMKGKDVCVYCGKPSDAVDHVIPQKQGGPKSSHNWVESCKRCNSSKGDTDLIEWWLNVRKKDIDSLPRIPMGIYLKLAYDWHKLHHTLQMPVGSLSDIEPFATVKKK